MAGNKEDLIEKADGIINGIDFGNSDMTMAESNVAIAAALLSIARDVHAMRDDLDTMRGMARTLDEIKVQLGFRR